MSMVGVRCVQHQTNYKKYISLHVDFILELHEYDVPYHMHFAIDNH